MAEFQIHDLDQKFTLYISAWLDERMQAGIQADELEDMVPEVYAEWLDTPVDWLGGLSPRAFYEQVPTEARVALMLEHLAAHVAPPEPLLDSITQEPTCEMDLLKVLVTDQGDIDHGEARRLAMSLLAEMGSEKPIELYIEWVAKTATMTDVAEIAAEQLEIQGEGICAGIQAAWADATPIGRELFLGILRRYPGNDKTLALLIEAFERHPQDRALYAGFLGGYDDARALPFLQAKLDDPEVSYLDYIEIKQAIEALGGTAKHIRSFEGDADYEALKGL